MNGVDVFDGFMVIKVIFPGLLDVIGWMVDGGGMGPGTETVPALAAETAALLWSLRDGSHPGWRGFFRPGWDLGQSDPRTQ